MANDVGIVCLNIFLRIQNVRFFTEEWVNFATLKLRNSNEARVNSNSFRILQFLLRLPTFSNDSEFSKFSKQSRY